ncbi:MAG: HAD family hydrolase [Oscillospiraceae bacterium]|nr:HAD family hydrolase [Oscillospiraceae bacterium]
MKKTVLFDLDGTLLPMDQELFVKAYFGRLARKLAPHGYESDPLIQAIWAGTAAMVKNNGSRTNEEVFWTTFCALMGEDCRTDEPLFAEYYEKEFQQVEEVCGKNAAAAETIALCKDLGAELVLATNPIFPAIATESRIRWAGLRREDFRLVTTYENSRYCKPNPAYYREILQTLGLRAEDCLMVGNDAVEDLAAAELGMPVFLLTDCLINKSGRELDGCPHGGFPALQAWLRECLV